MSNYVAIKPGTRTVIGEKWSCNYEYMVAHAANHQGIVSTAAWLRSKGVRNPTAGLQFVDLPTTPPRYKRKKKPDAASQS